MSRIIMLVPLNKNVSLTTITLSLIYLISKKTKKSFFESFFYFSLVDDSADKTKFIINKYFSNHLITLENINFLEQCVYSNKYNILVNRVIDQCYKIKDINKLILIKGINIEQHIDANKINYEISQNINAEVIFVEYLKNYSLEYINKREKKIKNKQICIYFHII